MDEREKEILRKNLRESFFQKGYDRLIADMKAELCSSVIQRMQHDIAKFSYTKKDGSHREAYGTLDRDILEHYHAIPDSGKDTTKDFNLISYFDVRKKAWRSFAPERILEYDADWDIENA